MTEVAQFINNAYAEAMRKASGKQNIESFVNVELRNNLDTVLSNAESSKGVLTVLITSLVYKHLNPTQDVRKHQQSIQGGYSGRTFDTKYITPFLKEKRFPAMSTSGWLTRSLEQKVPYDFNYTGAIKPIELKDAFLNILDKVENNNEPANVEQLLDYLLQGLIIMRARHNVQLAKPKNLSIENIMKLLELHFHAKYSAEGASRLPVLALYAIYECLVVELRRFENKKLLPLESHTSADARSGRIADIDVVDSNSNNPFEAVEVKFDVPVSHDIVEIAIEKIRPYPSVARYYILSTFPILESDAEKIESDIRQIKNTHNCQLVINGIMPTLRYYLRLLNDTGLFINNYVELLASDKAIKFEHKIMWNQLISKL